MRRDPYVFDALNDPAPFNRNLMAILVSTIRPALNAQLSFLTDRPTGKR